MVFLPSTMLNVYPEPNVLHVANMVLLLVSKAENVITFVAGQGKVQVI